MARPMRSDSRCACRRRGMVASSTRQTGAMTEWLFQPRATARTSMWLATLPALSRGFAVLSTDAGHNGADPANASAGLLSGNMFGLDPQARLEYGYAATGTTAPIAKFIIKSCYGISPSYSYMLGCSNGGRHGMVAAARYPDYFDGILAGDPGFDLPRAGVQHARDIQSFRIADPDTRKSFFRDDMKLTAAKVVEKWDDLDGVQDGMVTDMRKCQSLFRLSELQRAGEKAPNCLTANHLMKSGSFDAFSRAAAISDGIFFGAII